VEALGPPAPDAALLENEAGIEYQVMTQVPENWIPFIPVHIENSNREIQLRRAAMPPDRGRPQPARTRPAPNVALAPRARGRTAAGLRSLRGGGFARGRPGVAELSTHQMARRVGRYVVRGTETDRPRRTLWPASFRSDPAEAAINCPILTAPGSQAIP